MFVGRNACGVFLCGELLARGRVAGPPVVTVGSLFYHAAQSQETGASFSVTLLMKILNPTVIHTSNFSARGGVLRWGSKRCAGCWPWPSSH